MASCLGIYTDRNMIKYAKITSGNDKIYSSSFSLDAYGVKFYDNIQTTVREIMDEVGAEQTSIALSLSNENYFMTQVFSNLKKKDMIEIIESEHADRSGMDSFQSAVQEMRFKLALNSGSMDKNTAVCVFTSKGELANLFKTYEGYKISSIVPLPVSIKNLFPNQAIDEEAIVINIEDKTTVTVFHRSELQHITSIPLGMQEVITKLTEKYNSVSKAYEACKRISAYISDAYDMDDESRDILDVVIPTLYDIRQQVDAVVTPYLKDAKKIYITGTGAIINNIDLYFSEVFLDTECEILRPYFAFKDDPNIKEIIEVNSAIALALDGLGMVETELNFSGVAMKAAGITAFADTLNKLNVKDRFKAFKQNAISAFKKLDKPVGSSKRKKRNVAFDEGLISGENSGQVESETDDVISSYGQIDALLLKVIVFSVAFVTTYSIASNIVYNNIKAKTREVESEISKTNQLIELANKDTSYLKTVNADYDEIIKKLTEVLQKIDATKESSSIDFNIPNFLSKLMFVIPSNVKITSISVDYIGEEGMVKINAESGQYAQLGFFVSRLKLEKILKDVNMEVLSDSDNIKILVSGVMP